jgi:predicted double-glycine peptidase
MESTIKFDYFRGMEAEQYTFYRIPKVLFTAECFRSLSCEAKVLYGLLLDRMGLSIKNRWFDEEDRVYIIFTVEELAELLNCGTQKVVRLLKELDVKSGIGLIEKKRLGLGKPNVIYVKNFMIQELTRAEKQDLEAETLENTLNGENHNSRNVKITIQESAKSQFKKVQNHNSRIVKSDIPEYPKSQSNNTEYSDIEHNENQSIDRSEGDVMERKKHYRNMVQEQIYYKSLIQNPRYQKNEVDELVELTVEVLMLPDDRMIWIAGDEKPAILVKDRFQMLNDAHFEYVLDSMKRNTGKVQNVKNYLLTSLYNAPLTMEHYYRLAVNHDLYGGGQAG